MGLTDRSIKNAEIRDKKYKLQDRDGLHIIIYPTGNKSFVMRYQMQGKRIDIGIGSYPKITLAAARAKCRDYRQLIDSGINPKHHKVNDNTVKTFAQVSEMWLDHKAPSITPRTLKNLEERIKNNALPIIGYKTMNSINRKDMLSIIDKCEARGVSYTAKRTINAISQIYEYAINRDLVNDEYNPTLRVTQAIRPHIVENNPHLNESEITHFYKLLLDYQGRPIYGIACQFLILTMVRTIEMRKAEWRHIDMKARLWRIPAEHMKTRKPHIVPLSNSVISILEDLPNKQGRVFTGVASKGMSENAILSVIRTLGYKGRITGHGFRSTASTILNEKGHPPHVIDRQLAHEKKGVEASYNHAQYLSERVKLMQAWDDIVTR